MGISLTPLQATGATTGIGWEAFVVSAYSTGPSSTCISGNSGLEDRVVL